MLTGRDLDQTHPAIADLARRARRRVPHFVWAYLDSGTGADAARDRNRAALDSVTLATRVLMGRPAPALETELLGRRYALPVGFAPVGMSGLVWPGAEAALARLSAAAGVPMCLSTVAAATPEEVGPLTPHGWFQLYPPADPEIRRDLLARAKAAGFGVLVLTADLAGPSRRERLRRAGLTNPMRMTARAVLDAARRPVWSLATLRAGIPRLKTLERYADTGTSRGGTEHIGYLLRTAPDWAYLEALRAEWDGPLVVKGVLDPGSARRLEGVADAIWVSNHGGRQFDAAPSGLTVLPAIRAATALPVIYDGGIASGTDILRAVALGADMVMVGRAVHHGLAAFGAAGAAHALHILKAGLEADLAQLGLARPADARDRVLSGPA